MLQQKKARDAQKTALTLSRELGLSLDPWQAAAASSRARQVIQLCGRQTGKTTVTSLIALDEVLHRPQSLTLVISPGLRQSGILFKKIARAYVNLGRPVPAVTENKLSLELVNGSEIHALPGDEETIRGFSGVTLIIVDEASRVDDATYQSIRPMLAASGGRMVLMSTPFGKRGFFHHEWTEGEDWERHFTTAYECPRISTEWLAAERRKIGEWWFKQEYLCEFVDTEDQLYSSELIQAAYDDELVPLGLGGFEEWLRETELQTMQLPVG